MFIYSNKYCQRCTLGRESNDLSSLFAYLRAQSKSRLKISNNAKKFFVIKLIILAWFWRYFTLFMLSQEHFSKWKLSHGQFSKRQLSKSVLATWNIVTWGGCPWEKTFGKVPNSVLSSSLLLSVRYLINID